MRVQDSDMHCASVKNTLSFGARPVDFARATSSKARILKNNTKSNLLVFDKSR